MSAGDGADRREWCREYKSNGGPKTGSIWEAEVSLCLTGNTCSTSGFCYPHGKQNFEKRRGKIYTENIDAGSEDW